MRKLILISISLFLALLITACRETKSGSSESPMANVCLVDSSSCYLQFESLHFDYGLLKIEKDQEKELTADFRFTNSGTEPIVITRADVSCGCITPEIPKAPILPGQEGIIRTVLNTRWQMGTIKKTILVRTNVEQYVWQLSLTAQIDRNTNH